MSDFIIRAENLGKSYRLRRPSERQRYVALRDLLAEAAKSIGARLLNPRRKPSPGDEGESEFWALRSVSFDIAPGEVVGIVGRNGAGKSTLLKVLSRITEPTEGRVRIRGRVASLLEVGTGFHPELTGRENIFLNGSILGMSRAEIRQKFDEIVAFAEVDQFLDTPVKRYSSGMYVRLAFAVAAHLQPEILVVDEVLAVGDAQFQKKCLGKMQDVSRGGRTVLFVSHNMAAVRHLCSRGIYLVAGQVRDSGPIDQVVNTYLSATSADDTQSVKRNGLELVEFKLCTAGSPVALTSAIFGRDYEIRVTVRGTVKDIGLSPVLRFFDGSGTRITSICGPEEGLDFAPIDGTREWTVRLPALPLFPGRYSVSFHLFGFEPEPYLEVEDVLVFTVEGAHIVGAAAAYRSDHGLIRICDGMTVVDILP
jgi:lipopolysaccharide transport system ATP-binding protein